MACRIQSGRACGIAPNAAVVSVREVRSLPNLFTLPRDGSPCDCVIGGRLAAEDPAEQVDRIPGRSFPEAVLSPLLIGPTALKLSLTLALIVAAALTLPAGPFRVSPMFVTLVPVFIPSVTALILPRVGQGRGYRCSEDDCHAGQQEGSDCFHHVSPSNPPSVINEFGQKTVPKRHFRHGLAWLHAGSLLFQGRLDRLAGCS